MYQAAKYACELKIHIYSSEALKEFVFMLVSFQAWVDVCLCTYVQIESTHTHVSPLESRTAPFCPSQNMLVPPNPPCSAPRFFSARFRSVWREYSNKTFLNYYGTLPVSFVCTVCYQCHMELQVKFDFCDRFVIHLQQLCWTSRVTHSLLYFWMI